MGAWGALIMSFFGAIFAALTIYWQGQGSGSVLALPFIVFALIASAASYVIRLPGDGIKPSEKVARTIAWSSLGEGIGLFIVANVVLNLRRPDLLLPAMALVVGLHFIPIAVVALFRPFLALGASLISAAIVGVALGPPAGGTFAGFMAAAGLWLASVMAVRRDWRAKRLRR